MKKILSILLLLIILMTTVFASSAQDKLNNTKVQLKDKTNQLNQIKSEKKDTLTEIGTLDKNINSAEVQIDSLEKQIKDLEYSIVIAEENIKLAEAEYERKDNVRKERVLAYFKSGNLNFWDMLFSSKDISDLLYRCRLMKDITEYDINLLAELELERQNIERQKETLEGNRILCQDKKLQAEEKKLALEETKEIRTGYLSKLEASEKDLSASIDKLNAEADKLAAEIRAASNTSTKYAGGSMTWPLPGYYIITSPFGNRLHPVLKVYKLHTGIDIAGSGCNGKDVVAANSGTVIKAEYNTGYGNYIVIDHGGGITTLYGHSSKLLVKKGDYVTKGQTIMKVGTTGYSTGPHLHFEIRENGKYVNPLDSSKGYLKK